MRKPGGETPGGNRKDRTLSNHILRRGQAPRNETFRVCFRDPLREPTDCSSFLAAVRLVRATYPSVDFAPHWFELPQAGDGGRCADLPFGFEAEGKTLGNILHVHRTPSHKEGRPTT